jgi:adenylate cyclase 2
MKITHLHKLFYGLQVTEDTAKILMSCGYECESRGPIYVKGKGKLTTYFVKTPFDTREDK